jgi:hypothetical protein
MMKYILILVILGWFSDILSANNNPVLLQEADYPLLYQTAKPRPGFRKQRFGFNTFFVEGGFVYGYYTAQRYSLNYDLVAQTADNTALTLRIGFEKIKMNEGTDRNQIPFYVNFLMGRKNHLEISAGAFYDLTHNKINPTFSTGFRHHNPKGGFFYRVNFFLTTEKEINEVTRLELKRIWTYGPTASLGWSF